MKQSLQLRLGQNLTMTPQLQQAIRLLQLSSMDLELEIQGILESNLMLESTEDESPSTREKEKTEQSAENAVDSASVNAEESDSNTSMESDIIPDDLPLDSVWDDIYDGSTSYSQPADSDRLELYETQRQSGESLQEHLLWQMRLTPFSPTDQMIAMALIDSIDENGYLITPIEEIHSGLDDELEIDLDEISAVLHRIQRFDPIGVGSRNLAECLEIQLQQLTPDTPWLQQAKQLVSEHIDLVAARDFSQLMRRMKLSDQELKEVMALIQTLNPHPGSSIPQGEPEYIVPDVIVKKVKGKWQVELNQETIPKLRINASYAKLIRRADNSDDNNYLKNHLQEARWFLKSLQSRNDTLLKVARCIVDRQRAFLDYGDEAMKPLVLRDIAESVDMHESTISRVTTQKYMHTPRGILEFKYFFSSHVSTSAGGECSATAIRAIIKKLVAAESANKPLSDSKIAQILLQQGIKVARRTVAKYRESMAIPPSNERKRLA